ncbi:MAG: hypothetical protein LAO07_11130 [Acidobacteriia bacterium]|nr:hypothetical protein [Terriglobia bacterium]
MDSITLYEKRDELHRVLQSRHFAKAKKKSRFLEFVCEQTFLGNAEKLNEYLIGVEVYERGPDFDPQEDPIVRVQAHEIRRALRQFYEEDGKDSAYRLDLPPGHYVPIFKKAEAEPTRPAEQIEGSASPQTNLGRRNALAIGLALFCLVLGTLFVRERIGRQQDVARKAAEPAISPDLLWFWKPFLPPAAPPLIVIPNHPLLRAAHDGDSQETLRHGHLIPKEKIPEFRDTIHYRELRGFYFVPNETDFTAVGETLGLVNFFELFASAGQRFRLKASRLVDFEEIKRSNAILLGGNQPWSGRVFLNPEGFWFRAGVISNPHPRPGERPVYRPEFDSVTNRLIRDYALVLMLPNEKREERILLIYGIYTQGSQAAIEFVTNAERMQELRKALLALSPDRRTLPGYFQLLLTTTVENSVPGKASLVAARVIPG